MEPDILGRAYEYLLRKFAEGQGQSAGEFYTPREVAVVMARLLDPQPGMTVYDPCCGSGGLLIKCHLRLLETHGKPIMIAEGLSAIISPGEAAKNDFNLSPSRFVATGLEADVLPLDEAVVRLQEAEEERTEADKKLDKVLASLGFLLERHG